MFYYYDFSYILLIICIIVSMIASRNVNSKFAEFSNVGNRKGISGAEAARKILMSKGLSDVQIEIVRGRLADHYDPRHRVLRLSEEVYRHPTIASVSVAAHEVGHAIQHAEGYMPLRVRNTIVPVVNISSKLAIPLVVIGIVIEAAGNITNGTLIFNIGVLLFAFVVIFHLITLPVELNASSRALAELESLGIIYPEEKGGAKSVLGAAALTYVAALAVAVVQLLRLIMIRERR